ncbi:hypothetical protein EI94DRAFT_1712660 [Lactarius quietus]|nr:hypothetical protein EI94DRAFT_1712660 [Lactarius quietus]
MVTGLIPQLLVLVLYAAHITLSSCSSRSRTSLTSYVASTIPSSRNSRGRTNHHRKRQVITGKTRTPQALAIAKLEMAEGA